MSRMPEKITDILVALSGVRMAHEKLESELRTGPSEFYFKTIESYIEGLFSFAKFKVGDRVALAEDYSGGASGWEECKHFLKKGRSADVHHVDYRKARGFVYDIVFDSETWIDDKKVERPVTNKHTFLFLEDDLCSLTSTDSAGTK